MTRLEELRHWLAVLEELRPFTEFVNPQRSAFNDAWKLAYERAWDAAEAWAREPTPMGLGSPE